MHEEHMEEITDSKTKANEEISKLQQLLQASEAKIAELESHNFTKEGQIKSISLEQENLKMSLQRKTTQHEDEKSNLMKTKNSLEHLLI